MGVALVIAIMIGFTSLNPSQPNETDEKRFNVSYAVKHIAEIAKEPHSIFDQEAHTAVREYLLGELETLGANPQVYGYEDVYIKRSETYEDIKNIYGKIEGQTDSYIMLVTHYDSSRAKTERYAEVDGSFGAADAGYGLSTILETLRVIQANNIELVNGIKILITDGEEYGLVGAKEAVKEEEIFEGVEYLINLEARGIKGPAVMFETSLDNAGVVELYNKSSAPFSYSINPEIYRLLPNGTDFTVFLEEGIKGINISVLDSLDYYHTPNDSLANISLESLQHYGDQVVPIVTEFVTNNDYTEGKALESASDAIFFTLINKVFIKYSHGVNYILLALLGLGIIGLIWKDQLKVGKVFKFIGVHIVLGVIFSISAFGVAQWVAKINGRPFKITYLPLIPYESVIIVVMLVISLIVYGLTIYGVSRRLKEVKAYIVGALSVLFILSILFTIVLPGASYLTVFPAIMLLGGLVVTRGLCAKVSPQMAYGMIIPFMLIIILYVPTIYLFNCALTFGGIAVNMIFVLIVYLATISCALEIKRQIN